MSDSEVDFEDFSEADGSFADFDEELDHFEDTQLRSNFTFSFFQSYSYIIFYI